MTFSLPIANDPGATPPSAPESAYRADQLIDAHGRVVRDLRLSITDRCNYRCVYCMDPDFRYMPKRHLLSFDEYVTVARVCHTLGVTKLRLTGGEPTLYPQLDDLVKSVGQIGFTDIAMTTNGSRLHAMPVRQWARDGLHRITLSLDSLKPDRVARITRAKTSPDTVINAIRIAQDAGLGPIKVNAVAVRGLNDDEFADFADFARTHDVHMRLIEFMPLDSGRTWRRDAVVSAEEIRASIETRHELEPLNPADRSSTATEFAFADGAPGRIGIIATVTRPFCGACSRLRVTADGKVRPCLFSHEEWDLKSMLRAGAADGDVARFLADAMWTKRAGHGIGAEGFEPPERTMSSIGG